MAVSLFPPDLLKRRGSSVVERTLGKGEAESSILSRGTIFAPYKCLKDCKVRRHYKTVRFRGLLVCVIIWLFKR